MGRKKAPVQTNGEVKQEEKKTDVGKPAETKKVPDSNESSEETKPTPPQTEEDTKAKMETEEPAAAKEVNDNAESKEVKEEKPSSDGDQKVNDSGDASGGEDQAEDDDNDEKDDKLPVHKSLYIKIIGFRKLPKMEDELKLYYRFFTEGMGVEPPLVQIPGTEDRWVYFELKSLEDRAKLFTELKAIGHIWDGYKLSVKSVVIRSPEETKEYRRMSVEESIKVLYPLQDTPYSHQLREKSARTKELIEQVLPRDTISKYTKSKKYISNLRVKDMVPMVPIEGHEYVTTIHIEEDPETGETLCGLRAVSEDKEAIGIVPIDLCISIPRQMVLLVKSFVAALPELELKPYNHVKKEGDILGVSVKMTLCARFVMTVIIPKLPKIIAVRFKQLTEDGVEKENDQDINDLENYDESYTVMIKKKTEETKEKIDKYYSGEGKKYSLDSVYLIMAYSTNLKDEASVLATHILGLSFVPDYLNGVLHRLTGERSRPPIDALRPILGLIEAHAGFNSSTRVYLASPFRLVGLYFAKKCAHVTMFFSWTKENLIELQNWAKSISLNNIEFTNAKTHHRKTFPADNAIAVFWQFTKPTLAERFLVSGISNIISISYWNKNPPTSYIEQQKKQFETIYSKLKITHMYPVDLAPFTERIGLAIFFNGLLPYATHQFHRENAPAPRPLLGPPGPLSQPIKRLGPPGPMRGGPYNDRPGPWQRPDPWMGPGRSQLDQVASGVMQNLQAVQQQMQAFIPSLMDAVPMRPANNSWNKRYRDDYSNEGDSWNYGKRRRDDRGDW